MRSRSLAGASLVALLAASCSLAGSDVTAPGSESDPKVAIASAEAYLRRFPAARDRSAVLFRLALLEVAPGGGAAGGGGDRARSIELLERLLADHPNSAEAPLARVVLALALEQRQVEAELAARQEELDLAAERLDDLAALVSSKDAEVAVRGSETAAKHEEVARIRAELAAARAKLEACRGEVEDLEPELEELKLIDLSGPP